MSSIERMLDALLATVSAGAEDGGDAGVSATGMGAIGTSRGVSEVDALPPGCSGGAATSDAGAGTAGSDALVAVVSAAELVK